MSEEREQRNAVFSGAQVPPPGVDPRIQTTTAADAVKSDFGLDIPVETLPLPSGGKVYSSKSSLFNKETVDVRSMTTREEDILTSPALLKKGTVITELIRSCVLDKTINPAELTVGDRNALMVGIRITGYGAAYEAEVECAACNAKTNQEFNLAELPIQRLEIDPVTPGTNLFRFELPKCKKVVHFRFLTGKDEEEILATQERQKKLGSPVNQNVTMNLIYNIVSVDGIDDRAKIAAFVRMMPAADSLALRTFIRKNEPGILMKQESVCSSCGHAEEVSVPLGVTFLWPAAAR